MGTSYDPRRADYLDEMATRHETARVFDVCMSCQKCLNTCSVFPLLVTSIDNCVDRDAALLTPTQQDDIVQLCHQCTQCVSHCPHVDAPAGEAVNFPALVVRHRAMLRKNSFLTLRQQTTEDVLARSATHMSWSQPFRFFGAQLLRYVTDHAPALLLRRDSVQKQDSSRRALTSETHEVSFFPTCVIDAYAPEVGVATQQVFARVGAQCVRGKEHNCCGAPDLYNGNIKRFRRIVARNVRAFRASIEQGRPIVVGQPGCLHVMREHYATFSDDPSVVDVIAHLQDPWQFLAQVEIPAGNNAFQRQPHNTSLVLLQSSTASRSDGTQLRDVLEKCGWDVQVIPHGSVAETVWGLGKERTDEVSGLITEVSGLLEGIGGTEIVSESCLTNLLLTGQLHRQVRHPLEVLAQP